MATLPTPIPADQRAPTADPDADGVPNLLEYALAGDPMSGNSAGFQPASTLESNHLQLTYVRHRPDIDYTVEATSDLTTWTPIAINSGDLGAETTVTDPIALTPESPRRFMRVRVSEK
jgi:hypothetical protein